MRSIWRKANVAAICALALVMMLLVACGSDDDTGTVDVGAAPTATPPADTGNGGAGDTEDTPLVATPGRDLGGREVTIALWFDYWPWAERDADEPDPSDPGDFFTNHMRWENAQRVQDTYNAVITPTLILDWGQVLPTLTSSVMAGSPVADIIRLSGGWMFSAVTGNLVLPGSEFAGPETDLMTNQHFVRPGVIFEGEVWNFLDGAPHSGRPLGVNLDMINALGLQNPADLFEQGNWTWEIMREYMQLATRDTTGDGIHDQFGIGGQPSEILTGLLGSNDGYLVIEDTRTFGLDHPNSIRALEFFYNILHTDRTFHYDSTANTLGSYSRQMWIWTEGSTLFFPAELWMLNEGFNDRGANFDFTSVPWPQGPDNTRGYTYMRGWANGNAIPVGVQNPHDVYFIYEQIRSWPGDAVYLVREPYLENTARVALRTEADVQRVMNHVAGTGKQDLGLTIPGFVNIIWDLQGVFFEGTETVAQAIEARREQFQVVIDTAFAN